MTDRLAQEDFAHRLDDVRNVVIGQPWREWEADRLAPDFERVWIVFRPPLKCFLVKGMLGDAEIVDADSQFACGHCLEERVSSDIRPRLVDDDREEMIGVPTALRRVGLKPQR